MSNIDLARYTIMQMSGQDNYLTINKTFVQFMDSLEGGIFLQQLIFWSDKTQSDDGFFYKSYIDWKEEICLSEYAIRKHSKVLKEKGILETKLKKAGGSPTVHYKFDIDGFLKTLESFLKNLRIQSEISQDGNSNISVSSYTEEYNRRVLQKSTTEEPPSSHLSSEMVDKDFKTLQIIYDEHIGKRHFTTDQELSDLLDDFKDPLLIGEALKIAAKNGKPLFSYSRGVLRKMAEEKGVTTYEQFVQRKEQAASNKPASLEDRTKTKPTTFGGHELPF